MDQSFARWLWRNLKNITGISAKSRSERERKIGMILLFSAFIWLLSPFGPIIRIVAQVSHLLLGLVLTLHGDYLKSVESAEEASKQEREWRRQDRQAYRQLREMTIKQIAEAHGISLEEAAKKADEAEWTDEEGNVGPPLWMRETEEEAEAE